MLAAILAAKRGNTKPEDLTTDGRSGVMQIRQQHSNTRHGRFSEYHVYPGEGHGWRKTETIEQFYQSGDRFLRQYVVFA